MTGNPELIFTHNADGLGDTITRHGGSWLADGFQVGQTITIANSLDNNGSFQIAAISANGLTLTLVHADTLTNENDTDDSPFAGGTLASLGSVGTFAAELLDSKLDPEPITIVSSVSVTAVVQFHDAATNSPVTFTTSPITATVGISSVATSGNQIYSLSIAGSIPSKTDYGIPSSNTLPSVKGQTGLGAAGSVAINSVNASTLSYVRDANVSSTGLNLQAAGGEYGQRPAVRHRSRCRYGHQCPTNQAIAVIVRAGDGQYRHSVDNSQLVFASQVGLSANTSGNITAVGISGAVAGKVGIAGQVSLNTIADTTDTHIGGGSSVASDGPVALNATDSSSIDADGGGVAIAASREASDQPVRRPQWQWPGPWRSIRSVIPSMR